MKKILLVSSLILGGIILSSCGQDSEKQKSQMQDVESATESGSQKEVEYYTEDEILQARKNFQVKVIKFDATSEYGTSFPYSDYVRLQVTNNSNITLPYLTVLTKRLDRNGKMIGSSRAPSINTSNIKPGESFEFDYYPKGHLPGVRKITVEIEHIIAEDSKEFFKELNIKIPKN